jgi:DNA-binding response OmpR family regulator
MKSRDRLLANSGARCYIIPKIIDVFICKLRKKLANAGADNLIGTVWGRGYMIREPSSSHAGTAKETASQLTAA